MIKLKLVAIILAISFAFSGCNKDKKYNEENNISEESSEENLIQEDYEKGEEKAEETGDIYFIDNESGEMKKEEIEMETVNESTIWKGLQNRGIVPENANILSFEQDGDILKLDLDTQFGDFFRQQGTTGEAEVLKCIVNSYLDTFEAEKIKITETGYDLASSHKIYEGYLTKIK